MKYYKIKIYNYISRFKMKSKLILKNFKNMNNKFNNLK